MENEGTKKKRSWKKRLAVAVVLILLLYGVFLFPHTRLGITATVQLWNDRLEKTAERMLEEKPKDGNCWSADELFLGCYEITVSIERDSVFFENLNGWGYTGFYYSVDGKPRSHMGAYEDFQEYKDGWLWDEEKGDNWVYTVPITGNWYWYEAHF